VVFFIRDKGEFAVLSHEFIRLEEQTVPYRVLHWST